MGLMVGAQGDGRITEDGYKMIRVNGRYVYEHRHVMERLLGRPLKKMESVHHKNGDRAFNDESNLELWHKGQPAGQRVLDKAEWCLSFLRMYPHIVQQLGYEVREASRFACDEVTNEGKAVPSNDAMLYSLGMSF